MHKRLSPKPTRLARRFSSRSTRITGHPVDQADRQQAVLNIAQSLAQKEQARLVIFCATAEAQDLAMTQLSSTNIEFEIRSYHGATDITDFLARLKPRLLVVDQSHSLILTPQQLQNLSRILKCDLVITRQD